jgi:hypothetical protein
VTCPVFKGRCADTPIVLGDYDSPVHVGVGNGGHGGHGRAGIPSKRAQWARYQSNRQGYWQIQVANATHMAVHLRADAMSSASPLYSFEVTRRFPRRVGASDTKPPDVANDFAALEVLMQGRTS